MKKLPLWAPPATGLLILSSLVLSSVATAQDSSDPPSRVARIAYMTGPVSFQPASVDQWADASLNYPMTTGDSLYSDTGARAVLRIGQNSIRLNSGTNFQFVNLSDNVVQTSINAGGLSLRLRHLFDSESWEVDTPNGAITLLRTGEYRVDTDATRNATMVTVRSGDIEVTANSQSFPVHAGQSAYFDNSGNPPDIEAVSQPDDFDNFIVARDRLEDVPPPQYVSPDMVGYEDLNANGDWRNTPDGPVWTPRVAVGWTPYSDGHWAWISPWGWTWVDNASWGFAPFHYGRWAYANNNWGWYPGVVAPRPYYAPALVAFVGGAGFSVGISVGGGGGGLVGWFPLGPREAYYPTYQVSPAYVRRVNVTNTRITNINVTNVNVTNITYVNRTAVVAVPQNSFVSARPVRGAAVQVTPSQMQQAQVIGAAPKVAPQPQSVLANSSGRRAVAPPAALASRPVVARLPPPPAPVPFAAQQQTLQQHPGTPVARAQLQTLRTQAPAPSAAPGRMQIQPIDTKQVHAITPAVRPGPAPPLAQRAVPAAVQAPAQNPRAQPPVPPVATQNAPPVRVQPQPPVRQPVQQPVPPVQTAPAARPQPQPPVSQAPPPRPPVQPAPAARVQPQPPVPQAPPPREQVRPPVPPPAQPAPAVRAQPQPPPRPAPAPQAQQRAEPPARVQAPPPQPKPQPKPPQQPKEKKPEEKKE